MPAAGKTKPWNSFPARNCALRNTLTGQQLIAGTVLINGERVALNLQVAEGALAADGARPSGEYENQIVIIPPGKYPVVATRAHPRPTMMCWDGSQSP